MMKAKQYLNQLYRLDEFIKSNQEELDALREISTAIKVVNTDKDKVQESNSSSDARYVEVLMKIDELERLIDDELKKFFDLKMEIRTVINSVKNDDERLLLKLRYVNFYSWDKISYEMHMSIRTVHRVHSSALNNVIFLRNL